MALHQSVPAAVASGFRARPSEPRSGDVVISRENATGSRRYVLFQYPDSPQMTCPSRVRALQLAAEFLNHHGGGLWELADGAYGPFDIPAAAGALRP